LAAGRGRPWTADAAEAARAEAMCTGVVMDSAWGRARQLEMRGVPTRCPSSDCLRCGCGWR
jgi:hypothetical protein